MTNIIYGLLIFIAGYYWYPVRRFIRAFFILKKIDRAIKSVYAEQKEISDMLKEVDEE